MREDAAPPGRLRYQTSAVRIMMMQIDVPLAAGINQVSALLDRPADARWLYVCAHGAGAGMRHAFLERLGPRATLHTIEGGDHSFKVKKSAGRTELEVLGELAGVVREWTLKIPGPSARGQPT